MSVDLAPRPALETARSAAARGEKLLTAEARDFLTDLHRRFNDRRLELLALREERQLRYDAGVAPEAPAETARVRDGDWTLAPPPADLCQAATLADVTDLEDGLAPTWANVLAAHADLLARPAGPVVVRPRGWHLSEAHLLVDGEEISASLFDAGLQAFHAAADRRLVLDLPKLETHQEARLWSQVLAATEAGLGLAAGTIRVTVLVETLPAAFEAHEILYELREHAVGLRWDAQDYAFSALKRLKSHAWALAPDRAGIGDLALVAAGARKLADTCRRRGAAALDLDAVGLDVDLLAAPEGPRTEAGLREAIGHAVAHIAGWLEGAPQGRTASAEIARAQVWQWLRHRAALAEGGEASPELFRRMLADEPPGPAATLFAELSLAETFEEFLTLPAYRRIA